MLYHYCSYEKFIKIIDSKCLWLTNLTNSNDEEEVIRTFEIIWEQIKTKLLTVDYSIPNINEKINLLDTQMKTEIMMSLHGNEAPFGVCFSDNRDLSHNWIEYGDKCEGIALGFSNEIFTGINKQQPHPNSIIENAIGWERSIYDNKIVSQFMTIAAIDLLQNYNNALGWLNLRTTLKHYSAFIKNPTFVDERETRIVYYPDDSHQSNASEVSTLIDNPIPHCCLPWIKSNGLCALKEIIIGKNCEHSAKEIISIFEKKKLDTSNINITISECSYRKSNNR